MNDTAITEGLKAMRGSGKRPKVHDAVLITKLPKAVKALVQEYAKGSEVSDATIVRDALGEYFERRGYGRT